MRLNHKLKGIVNKDAIENLQVNTDWKGVPGITVGFECQTSWVRIAAESSTIPLHAVIASYDDVELVADTECSSGTKFLEEVNKELAQLKKSRIKHKLVEKMKGGKDAALQPSEDLSEVELKAAQTTVLSKVSGELLRAYPESLSFF